MELIEFKHVVVSRTIDGALLIALLDGELLGGRCVGLLSCDPETGASLCEQVGSALKYEPMCDR